MHAGEKLAILFNVFLNDKGKRYTYREISEVVDVTPATLSAMIVGKQTNPTLATLKSICQFFDISMDYFRCETPAECRAFLALHQSRRIDDNGNRIGLDPLIEAITHKAMGLSKEARMDALKFMEWIEDGDKARHTTSS